MRKKFITGAAVLALLMNSPQAHAEDVVIFGGEFEDESTKPVQPPPPPKESPAPVEKPKTVEQPQVEKPFTPPTTKSVSETQQTPAPPPPKKTQPKQTDSSSQYLQTRPQRFIKLAVDETYTYYLDKTSVQWRRLPYSSSEYIADVWVRLIERVPKQLDDDMAAYASDRYNAEISLAREQGYKYSPEDLKVLRNSSYVLEHYYLRPKTNQIQFLCELEVFGRPQNTVNERPYDYKNWENLVPGSVESIIYAATIKIIGTYKADAKGHMTFSDMLDEYLRISL